MPIEVPWGLEDDTDGPASKVPYLPIYLGNTEHFAIVDEEDYTWASQWRWAAKPSKNGRKIYAYRTSKYAGRKLSIFLHKEICLRAFGLPPTPSHIIVDHCNGNSLDCRRRTYFGPQLRWATPSENRQNYNGVFALQLRMDFKTGGASRLLRSHTFGGNRGLQRSAGNVGL